MGNVSSNDTCLSYVTDRSISKKYESDDVISLNFYRLSERAISIPFDWVNFSDGIIDDCEGNWRIEGDSR